MSQVSHIQTSFAGGEFGTSLTGRVDIAQYANACAIVENFLIRPYGSAISTPGTEFIRECKDSADGTNSTVRLIPFIFNRSDAYIIEMGDKYFRFYTNGGVVTTSGTVYTITHSYLHTELAEIQYAQLNDVIYFTHPDHKPQKLIRYSASNWVIEDFAFTGGPFMDENTTTITMTASATTGTVNLTLSATSSTIYFSQSVSTTDLQHINSYWSIGGTRTNATTGLEVQGYVKIATITSPSTATATVIQTLTTSAATDEWAEGSWSSVNGWPQCVTFHERRLFFARTDTEPQNLWASQPYIYEEFLAGAEDDDGLVLKLASNEANEIKWLASGKSLIAGTYGGEFVISSGDSNEPLTPSNVVADKETSWGSEPVIPKKIGNYFYYIQRFGKKLRELFYYWDLDTYKSVDKTILSPHISGDGFSDLSYQQNPETILWCLRTDGTLATMTREVDQEVQAWARQTTDGDYEAIATIPSQTQPYDEVWVVVNRTMGTTPNQRYIERFGSIEPPDRQDKMFYVHSGLTYDGYAQTTGSTLTLSATNGSIVLSIAATTSTTKFVAGDVGQRIRAIDADGVTLGEATITSYSQSTIVVGTVSYTFSTTSYASKRWALSVETITGLDHLEGNTVVVLADGGLDKPNKVVTGGTITLANDYFVVTAGLPYTSTLLTLPIEAGSEKGTAQGKIQKINQVAFKVNRSHKGFYVGGTAALVERISFRDPTTLMGTPESLYTGIIPNINFRDDYRYGSQVRVENRDPLPLEILSITSELETHDK